MVSHSLAYSGLEVAVALAVKFLFYLVVILACYNGVDSHKVVDAVLALSVSYLGVGIGDSLSELSYNGVLIIKNVDAAVLIFVGLGHFLGWVLEAHYPCALFGNVRLGNLEQLAVLLVEALSNVS